MSKNSEQHQLNMQTLASNVQQTHDVHKQWQHSPHPSTRAWFQQAECVVM